MNRHACLSIIGAVILLANSAAAQTTQSAPSAAPNGAPPVDSVPEKIAPGAKPAEPTENLTKKLEQSNGVIQPKEVDPAIEKPAPATGDPNVVAAPKPSDAPAGAQPK